MTRHEILSEIKSAEAEAQGSIERAHQEKEQKISDATAEAANIVRDAESEAQAEYDKRLAEAAGQIESNKMSIIDSGIKNVDSMRSKASTNVDAAVEHLITEFMGLSYV